MGLFRRPVQTDLGTKMTTEIKEMKPRATAVAVSLGWLFSAVDITLLILFQSEIAEALAVPDQTIKIAIGVGLLGSALGGFVFAPLGDRFGRVRALGWAIILYSVATAGMAFSNGAGMLMGLRFLAGVGTGGEWSIGFALLTEVWSSKSRGAIGGLVAAMFNVGTFIAIGFYHSGLGWRTSFALMFLPALGVAVLRRLVPESRVWQAFDQAKRDGTLSDEMKKIAQKPPVIAAFKGRVGWLTWKAIFIFALMNLGFFSFSTVFITFLQHDASAGGLGLTKAQELPYHLTLNLAGLFSAILAGYFSDRLGRRLTYSCFCGLGAIGFGVLYSLLSKPIDIANQTPLIAVFAACCLGFGINGVMGILIPELYPTHLRSTGPGVCQNLGKGIGGMMGPPAAGALVLSLGYQTVLVLPGIVFLVLIFVIWTLPEVGGREVKAIEEGNYLDA